MSDNANRKNNYRGNRHNNNNKKFNAQGNQQNAGPVSNNSSNSNKKRPNNKNRRPKSLTPSRIIQKYENLLDQHIVARKKYFEMFGRIAGKQLEKIEQNFSKTLEDIQAFQQNLKDWQKDVLNNKLNQYPEDRQFSKTHDLEPVGDVIPFEGDFEDPHLLPTQKAHEWSQDTEETTGTYDDYKKYKGIVD